MGSSTEPIHTAHVDVVDQALPQKDDCNSAFEFAH